jgi:hypothetical protein
MMMRSAALVVVLLMCLCACALAADAPAAPKTPAPAAKMNLEYKDADVRDVLKEVGQKLGERVLVEKSVQGKITLSLKDVDISGALTPLAKAVKCEWRLLYLPKQSPLLDNPDGLASTVRLIGRLQFPDVVISDSTTPTRLAHICEIPSVKAVSGTVASNENFVKAYLVTNDVAATQREAKENAKLNDKAAKYAAMQKQMLDMMMEMTPEEREQAFAESTEMWLNMDPSMMGEMMKSMMKMNPEVIAKMNQAGMQYFMQMPAETRRAMIRMNMNSMRSITPEQMKVIQGDAEAVIKEMQASGEMPGP